MDKFSVVTIINSLPDRDFNDSTSVTNDDRVSIYVDKMFVDKSRIIMCDPSNVN